ncbi:MAG: type II toxin-antitoxin system RelE/ParE family toxin [Patescibacteria group bacterium]
MSWQIDFHKDAAKFLKTNNILQSDIIEVIKKALKRFQGETVNINIAKLRGVWSGFYRVRVGNIRVIAEFDFDKRRVYIENIDWRGRVYKK